ncbi:hypothetical protein L914_08718 [Phytophthora nicotianae]|uniref:Uncharacterized protein n=1 Tax=Phytophthora nicotianae TaxID=4792 RepID=W2NCN5_PHYNI|nr:hypothetical protein L914_08718 [Phytophthora nicotianae]
MAFVAKKLKLQQSFSSVYTPWLDRTTECESDIAQAFGAILLEAKSEKLHKLFTDLLKQISVNLNDDVTVTTSGDDARRVDDNSCAAYITDRDPIGSPWSSPVIMAYNRFGAPPKAVELDKRR